MPKYRAKSKISGEEFTFEWNGKGKPSSAEVQQIVESERQRRDAKLTETKRAMPQLPPPTYGERAMVNSTRPFMDVVNDPELSIMDKVGAVGLEGATKMTEMFSPLEAVRSVGRAGALLANRPDLYPQQLRQQTSVAGLGVDKLPGATTGERIAEAGAEGLTGVLGLSPFPIAKSASALLPAAKTAGRALIGGLAGGEIAGEGADALGLSDPYKRLAQTVGGLAGGVAAGARTQKLDPAAPYRRSTTTPPFDPAYAKSSTVPPSATTITMQKQLPAPTVQALPAAGPPSLAAGKTTAYQQPAGQPVQQTNMLPPAPQPSVEGLPDPKLLPPAPTKQIGTTTPAGLIEPPIFPMDQPTPRVGGAIPQPGVNQLQLPAGDPPIGPFTAPGKIQERIPGPQEPAGLLSPAIPPAQPKAKTSAPSLGQYAETYYGLNPAEVEAVQFGLAKWPGTTPRWVKGRTPIEIASEWQQKATNYVKKPVSEKRKKNQKGGVPLEVLEPISDIIDVAVMPMGARLKKVAPDLENLLASGKTASHILAGTLSDKFSYATVDKLSKQERWNMLHTLQGRGTPVNKKVQDAVDVFRSVSNDIVGAMGMLGGQTSSSKGKRNFVPMDNYYPQTVPSTKAMKKGEIRDDIIKNIVDIGVRKTPKEAELFLDNFIQGRENGKWTQDILDYMQTTGQAKNDADAIDMLNKMRQFTGRHSSLEYAREVNVPFYDPDPARVLPWHVQTAGKRLGEIGSFGQNDEKINAELAKLARAGTDIKEVKGWAESYVNGAAEGNTAKERMSRFIRAAQVPKLALAFIPNSAQTMNAAIAGDMQALYKGYAAAMTDKGRRFAVRAGALLEPSLLETGKHGDAGLLDKANDIILTPFKKTEQINRVVSANAGADFASRLHKLSRGKDDKAKWAQDTLSQLGIDHTQPFRERELLTAAHNFTKMTQFTSAPEALPEWASTWWGKVFGQFKSMAYQQTKFALDQTAGEIMRGHPLRAGRNVLLGSALAGLTGEAINAIRYKIKGQEREYESLAEQIAQNMVSAQAIGIMYDAFDSLEKGRERDWILGPGVGWGIDSISMGWNWATEDLPNKDTEMVKERAKKFYYRHGPLGSTLRNRNEN